jgi:hypothetical protein
MGNRGQELKDKYINEYFDLKHRGTTFLALSCTSLQ